MLTGIFLVATFEQVRGLARAFAAIAGDLDQQFDVHIAASVGLGVGHAFPLEAELLPALAPRWDPQLHLAAWGWHGNRRATDRFPHGNRQVEEQVFPFALKVGVGANANDQVQVTGWPSRGTGCALAGEP